MNEHFKNCAFAGCGNTVASSHDSRLCYACHVFMVGTKGVETCCEALKDFLSIGFPKAVVFYIPPEREPRNDEFMDEMISEGLADAVIYYLGDPKEKEGRHRYESIYRQALTRLNKYPKNRLVIFETSNLDHEGGVTNLKTYYDFLSRFKEGHIFYGQSYSLERVGGFTSR